MPINQRKEHKKVLAVASGGGHWVQLLRLAPAFADCNVVFAAVREAYRSDVPGHKFYAIPGATQIPERFCDLLESWIVIGKFPMDRSIVTRK